MNQDEKDTEEQKLKIKRTRKTMRKEKNREKKTNERTSKALFYIAGILFLGFFEVSMVPFSDHFSSSFLSYSYGEGQEIELETEFETELEAELGEEALPIQHEKNRIERRIRAMVSVLRKGDYASAIEFSVDQEKEAYQRIAKTLRLSRGQGKVTKNFQSFFNRLERFWVEWIEMDGEKAVAICIFRFKFFDSKSKKPIFKDRELYYYLRKVKDSWKISLSRLKYERYIYPKDYHR